MPPSRISPNGASPSAQRFVELGSSGLRKVGGYVSADFLPKLWGQSGIKVYTEMANNDPLLNAVLFTITMMLRRTKWQAEPYSESAEDKQLAEMVEEVLFGQLTSSWPDVLSEVSTMFHFGFAPMEIVWTKRDKGEIAPIKLSLRAQSTVDSWEYDQATRKELLGLWQQDQEHPRVLIPTEKLLLFRTETAQDNPEGRSILRGAYTAWVRKRAIEEAEGRAALRAAGVVVLRIPGKFMEAGASEDEKAILASFRQIAQALAEDRQGALILPDDLIAGTNERQYDLEYKVADGRRTLDMGAIVDRIDKRIASTVLADFILLGQQAVGSFALSTDKTSLFLEALEAWNDIISGVFNRQLLRRWWQYNGRDPKTIPTLRATKVAQQNLVELATYLSLLARSGMPLFPDEPLEGHLRKVASLPEPSPEAMAQRDAAQAQEEEMRQLQLDAMKQGAEAGPAGVQPKPATAPAK